ncbi:MAG: hypothetical protein JWO78_1336 [Micavibrio sp.]|nr:hypothetical protein [Micavibrio sp.]
MSGLKSVSIGPVGHETDPVRVREAFRLGCSAVIIDSTLPGEVGAEVACVPATGFPGKSAALREADGTHQWDDFIPGIPLTQQWLKEQMRRAEDVGFRPRASAMTGKYPGFIMLTLWTQNAPDYAWHIDKPDLPEWNDLHIHIHGDGMMIAVPEKGSMSVNLQNRFFAVASDPSIDGLEAADNALRDRGFNLVALRPGQMLAFNAGCLHRSARKRPDSPKLRAAMF